MWQKLKRGLIVELIFAAVSAAYVFFLWR